VKWCKLNNDDDDDDDGVAECLPQQRLMREVCTDTLTGDSMPDSLAASATPDEITVECHSYTTVQQLAVYVSKFACRADALTTAQVHQPRRFSTNSISRFVDVWLHNSR